MNRPHFPERRSPPWWQLHCVILRGACVVSGNLPLRRLLVFEGTREVGVWGSCTEAALHTCAAGDSCVPVTRIGRPRPEEGPQGPQPRQGLFRGAPVRELVLILAHQNGQSPAEVLKDPLSPSSSTGGGMQSPDPLESSGMRCGVSLCHQGTCCSLVQLQERGLAPRRAGRKEMQDTGQGGCRARGKGWRDGAMRKGGPAPEGRSSEGGGGTDGDGMVRPRPTCPLILSGKEAVVKLSHAAPA